MSDQFVCCYLIQAVVLVTWMTYSHSSILLRLLYMFFPFNYNYSYCSSCSCSCWSSYYYYFFYLLSPHWETCAYDLFYHKRFSYLIHQHAVTFHDLLRKSTIWRLTKAFDMCLFCYRHVVVWQGTVLWKALIGWLMTFLAEFFNLISIIQAALIDISRSSVHILLW